jgi:deoxycytidylate deaminase
MSAFDDLVEIARLAAIKSPCAKSQRGAVLFRAEELRWAERHKVSIERVAALRLDPVVSVGFNGQPEPFRCTGTPACKKACGMLCLHAEQRALLNASNPEHVPRGRVHVPHFDLYEMLHVKVEHEKVVAGGPPSCAQCSRMLVELNVKGIWLYELLPVPTWKLYDAEQFHIETMKNAQLGDPPVQIRPRLAP